MLTAEQNDRFTRVDPGTPMGEVMRRYWHPIAVSGELNEEEPTKEIQLAPHHLAHGRARTHPRETIVLFGGQHESPPQKIIRNLFLARHYPISEMMSTRSGVARLVC